MTNRPDDFDMWLAKLIAKRPNYASEYMAAILEENKGVKDNRVILSALKQIALAQGINQVAKRAGISRVTLSRALSDKGNPRINTFMSIVDAMGLRLSFSTQKKRYARA